MDSILQSPSNQLKIVFGFLSYFGLLWRTVNYLRKDHIERQQQQKQAEEAAVERQKQRELDEIERKKEAAEVAKEEERKRELEEQNAEEMRLLDVKLEESNRKREEMQLKLDSVGGPSSKQDVEVIAER